GVPPTIGYAGHWRIYEAAFGGGWAYLALLIVATALSVLAYARVIALCWWGSAESDESAEGAPRFTTTPAGPWRSVWRTEASPLTVALVVLTVAVVLAGVWPRAW
ncbi:MAG TPA: hypothetical protein VFD50_04650, partial [Thermoleophilia bacterium]|nr:hypothetical protein [Thermoleophilia bacterium]